MQSVIWLVVFFEDLPDVNKLHCSLPITEKKLIMTIIRRENHPKYEGNISNAQIIFCKMKRLPFVNTTQRTEMATSTTE